MKRSLVAAVVIAISVVVSGAVVFVSRTEDGPITPLLLDETTSAGINHVYDGEYPFFVGGGVATFDCNDDGMPDLYFAGGVNEASLYVNTGQPGGELRFAEKNSRVTDLTLVTGAYPLDIDNDEVLDLAVLRRGPNVVLRGLGDCTFEDTTTTLGIDAGNDWTVSFAGTWESGAQRPTLAFGSYLVPDTFDCAPVRFMRPSGETAVDDATNDTGTNATSQQVLYNVTDLPAHCTLSLLFSDWNRDGGVDLRVSNDRNYDREAREQLWRVRPSEQPREYNANDGWRDLTIWGMGIASFDLTGDGRPEVYLTSQADNKLQMLDEAATGPTYRDIALARGVTATRPYTGGDILPSTAWHPEFDDVNNDGFIDLFVSKGNVEGQVDYASFDPNNLLLGLPDGTFVERGDTAGVANDARSRGAAVVDLNLDGLLDLVVVNRRVQVEVRRNVGNGTAAAPKTLGDWIALRIRQPAPNTQAIGAFVEVRTALRTLTREITVGGGHASGEAGWIHFGLGDAETAEVRVTYPGGEPGQWQTVNANSFYDLQRGAAPVRWQPTRD
jgi:hypothetical protein